ncbi:hypothetical protein CCR94_15745 [Rhodoblastus sphagnicola]|uniref:DUF1236 domain-containing protein n=1 Tax=Rhodoblastus sphagnicola TaxID=333368 RepID=A0A2S6N3T5_9HYPH|nr:DUF1236 domain-containing protein [Rhodoblastus sphagnicola]MBB4198935.1 hypothetical protein [Rhodoblastus sphagnicola]PPQ29262.1 hypothetical protein CCR94_15745 [Rhodoblastus sphagnicola]
MPIKPIRIAALIAAFAALGLSSVQAQGVVPGAERGAREGSRDAGAVGAVVGGAVGAVVGGVNGLLGADDRPRFRKYALEQNRPAYHYGRQVVVGAVLPEGGVVYYEAPEEYHLSRYRYTVIDGTPVLVDPQTHTIVEVIE